MSRRRSLEVVAWDDAHDGAYDLEPLDPGTGRALPERSAAAPASTAPSSDRLRWLAGIALLAGSVASTYVVVNHRAAATLQRSWSQAAAERAQLSVASETLRARSTFLDVSEADVTAIRGAREAAVEQTSGHLRDERGRIAGTVPLEPRMRSLRQRMLGHLDRWIRELDEFTDRGGVWVRTAPTQQLDPAVATMSKRWRVARHDAAAPPFVAADRVIDRLSRPTDVPVPLRFTAFTARGNRVDVDLRTGTVSTVSLGSAGFAAEGGPASVQVVGDRLVVDSRGGGGGLATLPLESSASVTRLDGLWVLPPTPSPAPWLVDVGDAGPSAVPFARDHPPVPIPYGWWLAGSSKTFLVLAQLPEEHSGRTTPLAFDLVDIATGRRTRVDADAFLGTWGDTTLWGAGNRLVARTGEAVREVQLPPGTVASRAAVARDGTIVVAADAVDPVSMTPSLARSSIVVVDPGEGEARVVAEAVPAAWYVGAGDGWALFVSGVSYTRSQVRAVELATGRELIVRLEDPFLIALAVH